MTSEGHWGMVDRCFEGAGGRGKRRLVGDKQHLEHKWSEDKQRPGGMVKCMQLGDKQSEDK